MESEKHRNRTRERRGFRKKRVKENVSWHRKAPGPPAERGAEALVRALEDGRQRREGAGARDAPRHYV